MKETLEKIIAFADHAHGDQRRKYSDERYIVHPVRVMQTCQEYTDDITVLGAAILHDVLEDTSTSEEEMRLFLDGVLPPHGALKTLKLVIELTDVYTKKNYPSLNRKARKAKEVQRLSETSAEAQTIKYADIIDNSINIAEHDPDFSIVFLREAHTLLQNMNKGNRDLYERATHTVEDCLNHLETKKEFRERRQVHNRTRNLNKAIG